MSFEDSLRLTGSQLCGLGRSSFLSPRFDARSPFEKKFLAISDKHLRDPTPTKMLSEARANIRNAARETRVMVGRKSTSSKSTSSIFIPPDFLLKQQNDFFDAIGKHFDASRKSAQEFQEHLNKICKVKF